MTGPETGGGDTPQPRRGFAGFRALIAAHRTKSLVASIAAQNGLRLISNLVLTRLLAPEAFGAIGVITSVSVVLTMLMDMGYHPYIVRAKGADEGRSLDVIWTLKLVRGALLTALMFAAADPIAGALAKPELADPIRAASFLFLLEGVKSLHPHVAERQRRISYVAAVELLAIVVQVTISIAAAFALGSLWALVIGMYAGAGATAIFSYALYPGGAHRIAFDRDVAARLWNYARVIIPSSIVVLFTGQADKFVLGRLLSLEAFGLYSLAATLVGASRQIVTAWINRVLFPLFAETARTDPARLGALAYSSRRRFGLALALALGAVAGGGALIARILFDDRYLGAGPYISLLSIAPICLIGTTAAEAVAVSLERLRGVFTAHLIRLGWLLVAGFALFRMFGVFGFVAAVSLMEAVALIYWWSQLKSFGVLRLREEGLYFAVAAIGAAIGFGAQLAAERLIAAGLLPMF
jgi:lipopolysaccharide exporter